MRTSQQLSRVSNRSNPTRRRRRGLLRAAVESCEPRRLFAAVTGTVFQDRNGDGAPDTYVGPTGTEQPGMAGITVYADRNYNGTFDAGDLAAVTDADGRYLIDAIPAEGKSVAIRIRDVPAVSVTSPAGGAHSVRFNSDYVAANRNFTYQEPAVTGVAYNDANRNGVRDAGEGIQVGVQIALDYNGNGKADADEPLYYINDSEGGVFKFYARRGVFNVIANTTSVAGPSTRFEQTSPKITVDTRSVQTVAGVDVGSVRVTAAATASVTGTVFTDADQDGVRDAGEAGLGGKTVYADLNYNGVKESSEPSAVTDANGVYAITGIAPQASSVAIRLLGVPASQVTAPAGGFHSGKLTAAITYANRNFGVKPTATPTTTTISGVVFDDTNFNGVRDAGEVGKYYPFGVSTIYGDIDGDGILEDDERAYVDSETGAFSFANVPVGRTITLYYIAEYGGAVEAGEILQTTPFGIGAGRGLTVTTTAAPTKADFGFAQAGTLSGYAVVDVNGNGTADAADPLTSGTFWLDADGDKVRDADEFAIPYGYRPRTGGGPIPVTTLAVPYGTYSVAFSRDGAIGAVAEQTRSVTVSAANPTGAPRFAVAPTQPAVTGVAFYDTNFSGSPDADEGAVSEFATIFADYNNNGILDAGEAASDLPYGPAGTPYYLPVEAGRSFTLRLVNFDGEAIGTTSYARTLAGTQQATGLNFAVKPTTGNVSGTVFRDSDADGVRDAGEVGLSGVIVYADKNYNGRRDAGEFATVTDADGFYRLTGIAADGTSTAVRVVEPDDKYYFGITTPAGGAHSAKFASAYEAANRNFGLAFVTPT